MQSAIHMDALVIYQTTLATIIFMRRTRVPVPNLVRALIQALAQLLTPDKLLNEKRYRHKNVFNI